MFPRGSKILVGLSGGPDSVTLLHLLLKIKEDFNLEIAAVHVNHMLRGEESERDERFVTNLCEEWNVPLFVERVDVPSISKGRNVEAVAREERYKKFREVLKKWKGDFVALGHTASDLAETVILNLTKGTGIKGLRGFSPKREVFVRPLFEVTRGEVEAYVRENALPFVTDSSNFCLKYERNLIRHKVVPVLKRINPSFERSVLRTSEVLSGLLDFLDKVAEEFLDSNFKNGRCFPLEKLKGVHPFLLSEVIRKAYRRVAGKELSFEKTASILQLLEKSGYKEFHPHKGFKVFKDQKSLCFEREKEEEPFYFEVKELPATVETPLFSLKFQKNVGLPILSLEEFNKYGLVVRTRRAGDKIEINGVHKKLKKFLIERKVSAALRSLLPVVECNGRIIFIPGLYSPKAAFPSFVGVQFEPKAESIDRRGGNPETDC